jgi:hypothetical protein
MEDTLLYDKELEETIDFFEEKCLDKPYSAIPNWMTFGLADWKYCWKWALA